MAQIEQTALHGGWGDVELVSQTVDVLFAGAPSPGDEQPRHEQVFAQAFLPALIHAIFGSCP